MDYSSTDKYTASIDFSNACRQFYIKRVRATESLKDQIKIKTESEVQRTQQPKTSMETSMDRLRKEMASLMDQDVSLMKQLLTLNETIEDIKSRRLYGYSKESLCESNADLDGSRDSFSDLDLYDSDDALNKTSNLKYTCVTVKDECRRHKDRITRSVHRIGSIRKKQQPSQESQTIQVETKKTQVIHGAQSSIDSGYDESDCYQTDIEVTI